MAASFPGCAPATACRLAGLVLLAALAAQAAGHKDRGAPATPPPEMLPRAAITSSDGAFEISAPTATLGYRVPVLFFADNFRKAFLHATHLELPRVTHPILIRLGNSASNDTRVIAASGAAVTGGEREWIDIPDPEHGDLDELRTALARALVRTWRRAQPAPGAERTPQDLPDWLVAGAARYAGGEHRLEDFESIHAQWARGRLPPLAELLAAEPPLALRHPALQAVLAEWLLDRTENAFALLLKRLQDGTPWTPDLVAQALRDPQVTATLAEDWDAWQVMATREVRQPGVTTPGMVSSFRAQLQVCPADFGLAAPQAWRSVPLESCLAWPASAEVQAGLRNKAMALRLFAAGRDGTLQRVASAYAAVLEGAARGDGQKTLQAGLAQAEGLLRQLEAQAATGAVLRAPGIELFEPRDDGRKTRRNTP